MILGRRKHRVRVTKVHDTKFEGKRYEITPETYQGPWELPVGTVLEIVSTSKERS